MWTHFVHAVAHWPWAAGEAEHRLRDKFAHAGDSLKEKWWLIS
jgi:hypothetical protein